VTKTNRLGEETSPYLRQHAGNPVDWYPWGPEAFEAARTRDVPILLSVGYSACHWCHVMAHESFEDPVTAGVMNEAFVNVKVDREERPDVDAVYMEAVQAIAGSGGWPMTVFLLPDGRPFFGGTYFPRDRFVDLMQRVAEAWSTRREGLEGDAEQLSAAVRQGTGLPSAGWAAGGDTGAATSPALLAGAADGLLSRFDPEWGGFGRAPKFPQPPMVELLLQAWARTGRSDLLAATTTTLDAMASGGIYDHLGGGFARYATDRRWLVPHFEKMLYDNALLVRTYSRAWAATGAAHYRQVVEETVAYLLRPPVRQADGGLSSAEDADSEGEEGRFYVWSLDELTEVGGSAAASWYGASASGNWEGRNILWRPERADLLRPPDVEAARAALYARRDERVRPGLDDKVLTEWNAMAVAALAEAGATFGRPEWVAAAAALGGFLVDELRVDGRWRRSWQAGRTRHLAYASDHAWLVEAFTRLSEATGEARWMGEAQAAADALLELFWDADGGGLHTTGADAEALIARPKDTYDGAVPSAHSVAATALLRLGALTGAATYGDRATDILTAMGPALAKAPVAFSGLVAAADVARAGIVEVVVTGDRPDLVAAVRSAYRPGLVLAWGEPYDSPLWEGRTGADADGLAFVCRDYACLAPVGTAAELVAQLRR
jgi:uncharacterized protein YyaL (SSP411 family)